MKQPKSKSADLKIFISSRESICDKCGENLGGKAWITLTEDKKALCLECAQLDHLEFLPSGDAALTRRSRKYSTLSAVVLKWSRARKRYERQGLLVEEAALQRAETECLADKDIRQKRRLSQAKRRDQLDKDYVQQFAEKINQLYPKCPKRIAMSIAKHACTKYSGRVGRSAGAKAFDDNAVNLAVKAHIRHTRTPYDTLLINGWQRHEARLQVKEKVTSVLMEWQGTAML
jgi:hypothetical protein